VALAGEGIQFEEASVQHISFKTYSLPANENGARGIVYLMSICDFIILEIKTI